MNENLRKGLLKNYKPLTLLADGSRRKLAKTMKYKMGLSDLKALAQMQEFEKSGYVDDEENIKLLQNKLEVFEGDFIRDRPKKWIVTVLFTLLGLMLGKFLP